MNHAKTIYEEKIDQIAELLEELVLDAFLSVIRNLYDRTVLEEPTGTHKENMPF